MAMEKFIPRKGKHFVRKSTQIHDTESTNDERFPPKTLTISFGGRSMKLEFCEIDNTSSI